MLKLSLLLALSLLTCVAGNATAQSPASPAAAGSPHLTAALPILKSVPKPGAPGNILSLNDCVFLEGKVVQHLGCSTEYSCIVSTTKGDRELCIDQLK